VDAVAVVDEPLTDDRRASVMGGAFNSSHQRTFGRRPLRFHAMALDGRTLSPAIGVRMCAAAGPYLAAHAPEWGAGEAVRDRVVAVGRRWAAEHGRDVVVSFLLPLTEAEGAASALGWLVEGARGDPAGRGS